MKKAVVGRLWAQGPSVLHAEEYPVSSRRHAAGASSGGRARGVLVVTIEGVVVGVTIEVVFAIGKRICGREPSGNICQRGGWKLQVPTNNGGLGLRVRGLTVDLPRRVLALLGRPVCFVT